MNRSQPRSIRQLLAAGFLACLRNPKTWLALSILAAWIISRFQDSINPYYYDILISIGINIILGVSLNLVTGYTGQFSLGHAGFMAVGAYASAVVSINLGWSFPVALLLGGLGAALAGFVVGAPSLRLKGDYLAIVTLGFAEIIRVIFENVEYVGAARGLSVPYRTGFFSTFATVAVTVYVIVLLVHSTYGRGFLTVRDDEIAAEAMGINTTKYKVLAFVIGAFFAGIAGGLFAHFKQFIHPEGFGYLKSVDIVVIVILGGMGNMPGVILAAILLTILPEGLRALGSWEALPEAIRPLIQNRMILYSLLLIVLMLLRPQGLFTTGGRLTKFLKRKKEAKA